MGKDISKEELKGYRSPTEAEKAQVERYVKREETYDINILSFWSIFLAVGSLAAFNAFIRDVLVERVVTKETILKLVVSISFAIIVAAIHRGNKKRRSLLKLIGAGDFRYLTAELLRKR